VVMMMIMMRRRMMMDYKHDGEDCSAMGKRG